MLDYIQLFYYNYYSKKGRSMKVIFLDVDGVLNNNDNLFNEKQINAKLVKRLAVLVQKTNAKLILSSAWRERPSAIGALMAALDKENLYLSGMTPLGALYDKLAQSPWKDVPRTGKYDWEDDRTFERGAEIAVWVWENKPDKFVIFDDDTSDISNFFPKNCIRTKWGTGLTDADVEKAIEILGD